jgi:hypothetical protein
MFGIVQEVYGDWLTAFAIRELADVGQRRFTVFGLRL